MSKLENTMFEVPVNYVAALPAFTVDMRKRWNMIDFGDALLRFPNRPSKFQNFYSLILNKFNFQVRLYEKKDEPGQNFGAPSLRRAL